MPAQKVEVVPDEQEAVGAALRMARPGDLVLLFADALARTWNQVQHFQAEPHEIEPAPASALAAGPDLELDEGRLLIRDERGVRLARETEVTD